MLAFADTVLSKSEPNLLFEAPANKTGIRCVRVRSSQMIRLPWDMTSGMARQLMNS
jgi:hypothetical protein